MSSSIYDKSRGRLLSLSDLKDYKPPPAKRLIHSGILNVRTRFLIFGDEGTFKSAIASHGGFSLARGSKWLKFDTSPCNILYIQGELSMSQTKERLEEYMTGSKMIWDARPDTGPKDTEAERAQAFVSPSNLVVETVTQDINLDTMEGYNFLKNEIGLMITEFPAKPIVLILDPLFKMFRYDLIKEEDIKSMTRNVDRLMLDNQLFANHPGMGVIIVHHARKAQVNDEGQRVNAPGSTEMFGSAHLKWWADTIMKCELDPADKTDSTVFFSFTKHRVARYTPPEKIKVFFDRDTYHPYIENVFWPQKPENYREFRGVELALLE